MHHSKTFQYLNSYMLQGRLNSKTMPWTRAMLEAYDTVAQKGTDVFHMMTGHLPVWMRALLVTQLGYCISNDFTHLGPGL